MGQRGVEGRGIGGSEIEADSGFLDGICQILAEMNEKLRPLPTRLEPWPWALGIFLHLLCGLKR